MRMRLGLLQDPAVIDRQIKKEMQVAEAARQKAAMPTVKTEEEMKAEDAMTEKEKEAIRKKAEERVKPRIRPLSEQKAIEMGANFAAETFIFAVGIGVILVEHWRQRRKEMQIELKAVKAELEELKIRHPEPAPSGGLLGFWKGGKIEEKKNQKKTTEVAVPGVVPTSEASALQPSSKPPHEDEKELTPQSLPTQTEPRHR
jgi:hypothetical protein